MILPLETLVARLQQDRLAYGAKWMVYCARCDLAIDIWPDKDGLVCGECGELLVAVVGGISILETTTK